MTNTDARKLVAGALLVGMSALPLGSFVTGVAGGVGGNWVAEALGGALGAPPPDAELGRVYERALRRAVTELRREYQREYGRLEEPNAFALLQDSSAAIVAAEPLTGAASIGEVQAALVRGLDGLLYGHHERQVALIKARLLEQTARTFQAELASSPDAWRLFQGWLLQRLLQHSARLQAEVSRLPNLLTRLAAPAPPAQDLDAMADRLEAELDALRAELQRLAAGQPAGIGTTQSGGVNFGSGNQFGTVNIGDVAGGNIYKPQGPMILGNITSGRDTNIADRQTIINREERRRNSKPEDAEHDEDEAR